MSIKKLLALGLSFTLMLSGAVFAQGEEGGEEGGEGGAVVQKVTLKVMTNENCTVSIDGEAVSEKEVESGTSVTIEANPADNYDFVKWVKINDDETSNDLSEENPYEFKPDEDTTVEVIVKEKEAPKQDPAVEISGTLKVGETLTANVTDVEESTALSYKWSSAGAKNVAYTDIADANEKTFTLTDAQEDKFIKVTVTVGDAEADNPVILTDITDEKIATSDAAPSASVVTINYDSETVTYDANKYVVTKADKSTVIDSYKSSLADEDIDYIEPGKNIYVRKLAAESTADSSWTEIEIPERPVMTQEVYGTNASYGSNDGKLTNFVPGKMEYKLSTESKWYAVNKQGVYNLSPGDYWVRLRATDESFASDYKVVSVGQDSKTSSSSSGGGSNSTYYSKNGVYGEIKSEPIQNTNTDTEVKSNFVDIDSHWAKANIVRAVEKGLFSGVSDDTFDPEGITTRGMIITLIARLNGVDLSGYTESKFADVEITDYYGAAAAWGNENNIVTGIDENNFDPNASLTREQIAVILCRYAQFIGKDVSAKADISGFADYSSVSEYALDALAWANQNEIVGGRDGNMLAPKGTATRAEVATMLMRFIDKIAD